MWINIQTESLQCRGTVSTTESQTISDGNHSTPRETLENKCRMYIQKLKSNIYVTCAASCTKVLASCPCLLLLLPVWCQHTSCNYVVSFSLPLFARESRVVEIIPGPLVVGRSMTPSALWERACKLGIAKSILALAWSMWPLDASAYDLTKISLGSHQCNNFTVEKAVTDSPKALRLWPSPH